MDVVYILIIKMISTNTNLVANNLSGNVHGLHNPIKDVRL